jgi:hypothetical protein
VAEQRKLFRLGSEAEKASGFGVGELLSSLAPLKHTPACKGYVLQSAAHIM